MRVDTLVIGAGVIGLAIARAFARSGFSVVIAEREAAIGSGTSSRNSEVIHAGIYYPKDSAKARFCRRGRDLLYEFCGNYDVPHRRVGKLIYASAPSQSAALDAIAATASANDVNDLERLDAAQVARVEPVLQCVDGLYSPSTGIIDAHAFMSALLADAEDHGATLALRSSVHTVAQRGGCWELWVEGHDEPALTSDFVINCAGLQAQDVAARIDCLSRDKIPPIFYAKGVYFAYHGPHPFTHLIYPVPEPGGLGTHLTLDMAGAARFGPDVEWIDAVSYDVPADRRDYFVAAARRIWSQVDPDKLHPAYAGVRPKLVGPGQRDSDFVISGPDDHGLSGLVNLFGIESPGLTASLAIADAVERLIRS